MRGAMGCGFCAQDINSADRAAWDNACLGCGHRDFFTRVTRWMIGQYRPRHCGGCALHTEIVLCTRGLWHARYHQWRRQVGANNCKPRD